jgi:hypothetical protein
VESAAGVLRESEGAVVRGVLQESKNDEEKKIWDDIDGLH